MPTLETAPALAFIEESRVIRATPLQAFEAWTKPEILKQWFGPEGRYCPQARMDLRLDGAYLIEVRPEPGTMSEEEAATRGAVAEGKYTKIVPGELLEFTWHASFNPGEENLVTVTFKPVAEGTEVTIRHGVASETAAKGYVNGWRGSLEKLAARFAR